MKILIKITQKILEESAFCNKDHGYNCAVAIATREIFPKAFITTDKILVNMNIELTSKSKMFEIDIEELYGNGIKINLPKEAQEFIQQFDYSDPYQILQFKPISFEIDVPNEVITEIGISQVYKILSESKTLELVNI